MATPDLSHLDDLIKQVNEQLQREYPPHRFDSRRRKLLTIKRSLEDVREMLLDSNISSIPWGSPI